MLSYGLLSMNMPALPDQQRHIDKHTHTHTHIYIYIYIYVCVCNIISGFKSCFNSNERTRYQREGIYRELTQN